LWRSGVQLSSEERQTLIQLLSGSTLKSHRDIEGNKVYHMHPLEGNANVISAESVLALRRKRLIETNHKFPAATFLLTSAGEATAQELMQTDHAHPLTARNFTTKK
jgi:hypothetical protein